MFTHIRGKVLISCGFCPWQSKKVADESAANLELAHHNYQNHPGVFPRWNPEIHVVEKEVKRKHGRKNTDKEEEGVSPSDVREGAAAVEAGNQPP